MFSLASFGRAAVCTASCLLALVAGCGRQVAVTTPAPPVVVSTPYDPVPQGLDAIYDWVHAPPMLGELSPAALRFQPPALAQTVEQWEAAAARAAEGWKHQTWYLPNEAQTPAAVQWWSPHPARIGSMGDVGDSSRETHCIRIILHDTIDILRPSAALLEADRQPATGWGGSLKASTKPDGAPLLNRLSATQQDGPAGGVRTYDCFPGLAVWDARVDFEDVTYALRVGLPEIDLQQAGDGFQAAGDWGLAESWSESPEMLAESVTQMTERLKAQVAEQVASREAVVDAAEHRSEGGTSGGDPLRTLVIPSRRPLSDEEARQLTERAEAELDRRRDAILEHADEIHGVIAELLPVRGE